MRLLLLILSCSLFAFACQGDRAPVHPSCDSLGPSASLNPILPLGASRVEGARPDFESFRYALWQQLMAQGWEVDFIGTQCDGADYPDGVDFDRDHEGRGGWTSGQIREGLPGWLAQAGPPAVVLFSSPGGNDALQGLPYDDAMANVEAIIDLLQAANPEVTILIEQMAPAHSDAMTPGLSGFFSQMQQGVTRLAAAQTDSLSTVIAVDMYTGFSDSLLADDVHYNEAGAQFIAERYLAALQGVLK